MAEFPRTPVGWRVVGRRSSGPFTTELVWADPAGGRLRWSSRAHRKHASRLSRPRSGREHVLWAPHRVSWWIAVLFVAGSSCFLVAPLPAFLDAVGARADAIVFFVGSLLFTSAAALQWLETVNADRGPTAAHGGRLRVLSWEPHRIDWWSSGVQLVGTLFFNVDTFHALQAGLDAQAYDRLVWTPDVVGSACFLVSGYLAYAEVCGGYVWTRRRGLEWRIAGVNLLGCIAFGISAIAAFWVPSSGSVVDLAVANVFTAFGGLCFLVGAILLLPESAGHARAAAGA